MKTFFWAFRGFLRENSTTPLQTALGVSENTVRSWAQPPESTFHRPNPIDRCIKVLDLFDQRSPQLLFEVLQAIADRYGYEISSKKPKEHYQMSVVNEEINDVIQTYLESTEDGDITEEEKARLIKEIKEAIYVLNQKLSELGG